MGILSEIKKRKGKKNREVVPEPEHVEAKSADEENVPEDDLYVKEPSLEVNQLIYLPLPKESYGKTKFEPEPNQSMQSMSSKGFHLALECMKYNHKGNVPEYADQFVRKCLYDKNLEIRALIEFCRTYPEYSGLRRELTSKIRSDGNFTDISSLSKNISSAKGLEESVKEKMRYEIASAVSDYIKSHKSFNYVESLLDDKCVSECNLQLLFPHTDSKTNPLYMLMQDALREMMDSSQDSETLNRMYFGTFSRMKDNNMLDKFNKETESCYWNNVIRFMKAETDIEHFGTMMRDVRQGPYPWDQPDCFPHDVSDQYVSSIDSLVVKPLMDGRMLFEDLCGKAALAMYLSKYSEETVPDVKDAIIKAISIKLSQNVSINEMSGMYALMESYIHNYNTVFNVKLTENDIRGAYEDSVIGKVGDSKELSESNMWYMHAEPRVFSNSIDDAMIKAYCDAMDAAETMDDLFDCYSKIEDSVIRDAAASEFAKRFFSMIGDHTCEEYEDYMSRLDDSTRSETLLFMGNNYPCICRDISDSILEEVRKLQDTDDKRYKDATLFQSEVLIEDFMSDEYEDMFSGCKIVNLDYALYYIDLLVVNGKHLDDLLTICVLMEYSGLTSELEERYQFVLKHTAFAGDPERNSIFGHYLSEFTDGEKDLETRVGLVSSYVSALTSAHLELTDSTKFLTFVSDWMGKICDSFGSEICPELSKSLYDYMRINNIPCMDALLSYAFNLILEGRYRCLPEIDEKVAAEYPDECALYKYVCEYMNWFSHCAERTERFPLDIDVPLKYAQTTFQKAMVYYIRSEVSQFFGNGQLVHEGWSIINNLCRGEEYALLRKKISTLAYKYVILEGNLDSNCKFNRAFRNINRPVLNDSFGKSRFGPRGSCSPSSYGRVC